MIQIFSRSDRDFDEKLAVIRNRGQSLDSAVEKSVGEILEDVRLNGDEALKRYTQKFDSVDPETYGISIDAGTVEACRSEVSARQYDALQRAADSIRAFHERQRRQTWIEQDSVTGNILGQRVLPLDSVGIYVPGGKAAYPSSVLMNAIPAQVAGVERIVMVVPTPGGEVNPGVMVAAHLLGITEIYRLGGAQAIGALAYGTETVAPVDKIVGPGNIYVATAKRKVFGRVDIDMIAGPSEILIIADEGADPRHVAIDLLSQAEHDEMASSILVTNSSKLAEKVSVAIEEELALLPRQAIARKSIDDYGAIIVAPDLLEAARISNLIAPEHLELAVAEPFWLLHTIKSAGAIFMGYHTSEAVGDYVAGPNHVLPTGGTARFFSPLSVDDFIKKSSLIYYTQAGLEEVARDVEILTAMEGLDAHGRSVSYRVGDGT
ncbi:histidinol dehydrogenase [Desulfurispira natronophila]|uniref:Histidinol dehydrogenase n=1 Tax=Desulfurispira natronophila TaxID=682562 RepID=A0A7W7Y5R2_9BACT|nr:histidinol dehydrogenase [Desulfurispira natronophila]MBB5022603.1 histidinol dehydrogenase [Desulfurispira natronophila]